MTLRSVELTPLAVELDLLLRPRDKSPMPRAFDPAELIARQLNPTPPARRRKAYTR